MRSRRFCPFGQLEQFEREHTNFKSSNVVAEYIRMRINIIWTIHSESYLDIVLIYICVQINIFVQLHTDEVLAASSLRMSALDRTFELQRRYKRKTKT